MKKVIAFLIVLAAAGFSAAQETKVELTSPATECDSKPNSDAVPDVYTVDGRFETVMIVRMKYKTDLLAGLENAVRKNKIHNAVILAGTGSVTSYHYHAVANMGFPTRNTYVKNTAAPADLVSMNGYIINGRVHAHATFTNTDRAFGGHLEPGTNVFTFAIVTIGILSDSIDLSRVDDKNYR